MLKKSYSIISMFVLSLFTTMALAQVKQPPPPKLPPKPEAAKKAEAEKAAKANKKVQPTKDTKKK